MRTYAGTLGEADASISVIPPGVTTLRFGLPGLLLRDRLAVEGGDGNSTLSSSMHPIMPKNFC
jgi:hypothetical protein